MFTWGQYEKAIVPWIYRIRTKRIQASGRHPLLTLHHLPNLEAFTNWNKKSCSSQNCTQFDSLPLDFLHNVGIWNTCLVHCNKLKFLGVNHTKKELFVIQSLINSNTPLLTNSCIMMSSNMCCQTDALDLTRTTVTSKGERKMIKHDPF